MLQTSGQNLNQCKLSCCVDYDKLHSFTFADDLAYVFLLSKCRELFQGPKKLCLTFKITYTQAKQEEKCMCLFLIPYCFTI